MTYHPVILVDAGMFVTLYNRTDNYHAKVYNFFKNCTSQLLTTVACITETMHLLPSDWRIKNELMLAIARNAIECEDLHASDFTRMAELNEKYADLPGDFADLTLIAVSERLDIEAIATLDSDFDIYRRYRKKPFVRVF